MQYFITDKKQQINKNNKNGPIPGPHQTHFSENMKAVAAEQRGLALWGPPVNLRTGNKKTNYANSSISHMQNITAGMHEQA